MRSTGHLSSFAMCLVLGCSSEPSSDGLPVTPGGGAPGQAGASGATASGGTSTVGGQAATGGSAAGGGQVNSGGASAGGFTASGGQAVAGAGMGSGGRGGGSGGTPGGAGNSSTGGSKATAGSSFGGSGGRSSGGSGGAGGASNAGAGAGGMGSDAQALFTATCASCHGDRGQGVAMLGPELQHPVRDFSTWVVRNGRQGNPAFPNSIMAAFPESALPNATLEAIYTWLSAPALPKPTTGETLYKDYCANCHGATGVGGTAGHDAKGEPLSKALTMVRGGHNLTQFSSRTGYMPKWTTGELSDAEVGLIVDYLDSL